jgi:hypothetical protein
MAGPNYGLIDNALVNKNRAVEGYGAVNTLVAQNLENQAAQIDIQNAMAEQAAGQAAGGDVAQYQKNLMALGRGKQSVAIGKAVAETDQAKMKALSERLPMQREMSKDMAFNPSNENIQAHLQDQILKGWITPNQAKISWGNVANMNPEQRREFFLNNATKAEDVLKEMETRRHNRVNEGISGGHLALARERLSQEMAGGGQLTPETIDVAANMYLKTGQLPQLGMGKQAAAARQQILNRATVLGTTGTDGQPAPTAADVAGNIAGAKQDYKSQEKATKDFATGMQGRQVNSFNTAIDHLDTMGKLSDALANGDTKAINAIGNMVAKQTGAPAPTSFNAAKQIVTAEVIKSIVASGGGVKERQEAEANFAAANSPAQLKGVINAYKDLMGGQLKSLELQYGNTTGRKDFEKKLTPAAKEELSKVKSNLTGADAQALEWAKANPNDPRAVKIKQRLGVQ